MEEQYQRETVQPIILFSPKRSTLPNTSYLQAFAKGERIIRKSVLSRLDKISQYSCEWKISVIPHVLGKDFLQSPSGLTCSSSFPERY